MKFIIYFVISIFLHLPKTQSQNVNKKEHYNVLLLIADDLGIGDLGCYGNTKIKTTNLDLMAKQGITFNSMYSVQSDTGSVAAILTGSQPRRFGLVKGDHGWDTFWSVAQTGGLTRNHYHLGKLFSSQHIKAHYTGRWNLGFQNNRIPTSMGFVSFYGSLTSHGVACTKDLQHIFTDQKYFWMKMKENSPIILSILMTLLTSRLTKTIRTRTFIFLLFVFGLSIAGIRVYCWMSILNPSSCILMNDNVIIEQPYDEDRLTLRMTNQVVKFLKYQIKPSEPFLYVMSYLQPKFPGLRSYLFNNKSGHGPYHDAIMEMDWSVGKILKTLEEQKMANNTLVIFVSDNGQELYHPMTKEPLTEKFRGSNFVKNKIINQRTELRGSKGSVWEGGIRVPAIMRLPGIIKPGSNTSIITSVMDIYPTIYKLMGFTKSAHEASTDGMDLFRVFENPNLTPSNVLHDQLYHYCDLGHVAAVTMGDIKIHFTKGKHDDCTGPLLETPLIFNISADPGESKPLEIKGFIPVLHHVKASIKQYEIKKGFQGMQYSQFDKIPNPFNFPCQDILSCEKKYEYTDNFNAILTG